MQQLDQRLKDPILQIGKADQHLHAAVQAWHLRKTHKVTEEVSAARSILAQTICELGEILHRE